MLGIDNSPEMIAAARAKGVDALLLAAEDMQFFAEFDAAFSNATLHWVLQKEQAARAIFRALKPGGRFAGEMGGEGNLEKLREALDEELIIRGYVPPRRSEQLVCVARGICDRLRSRWLWRNRCPADRAADAIDHGVAAWVTTFRKGWLERAGVPEEERAEIGCRSRRPRRLQRRRLCPPSFHHEEA